MNKKGLIIAFIAVVFLLAVFLLNLFYKNPASSNTSFDSTQLNSLDSSSAAQIDSSPSASSQGLQITDEKVGTGREVKSGDTVVINYTGTLTDGTKFDSSYDRNEPFTTQIGVGQVIKGWDLGVVGMKVGGKRKLVIPPDLAYGNQQVGTIPPNSTLTFEVELIQIK